MSKDIAGVWVKDIPKHKHTLFHYHLKRVNGKANKCENPECKSAKPKRFEWALRKGHEYSSNKEDYIMLCTPCHRKYDFTEEIRVKLKAKKIGELHNTAKLKNTDVLTIYQMFIDGVSNKDIAAKYKISGSAISNIRTGKNWPQFYPKFQELKNNQK